MKKYSTVILGGGWLSVGALAANPESLLLSPFALLDTTWHATMAGFDQSVKAPTTAYGKELYERLEKRGAIAGGKANVCLFENVLCEFAYEKELPVRFSALVREVRREGDGFAVSFCDNEGLHEAYCDRVIDAREEEGNCLSVLVRVTKPLTLPNADGFNVKCEEAFREDETVVTFTFPDPLSAVAAKDRAIAYLRPVLRENEAKFLVTSYRTYFADGEAAHTGDDGVTLVRERACGDAITAFERGLAI